MSEHLTVAREIEHLAEAVDRVAAPVGRAIDEVAFGGAPPRVVTFEAIHRAVREALSRGLGKDAVGHSSPDVAFFDQLILGSELDEEDIELRSEELVRAAADSLRAAVASLRSPESEKEPPDVEPIRRLARLIVQNVVLHAQLVGQQLLVVDLARAVGLDAVPLPEELEGGGQC